MGQDQSTSIASTPSTASTPSPTRAQGASALVSATAVGHDGIHLVQGSGTALHRNETSIEADEILARSNKLPIPQPLLPRPDVDDTITSGLQGTKMIQELKTLFDGFAVTVDETSTSLSNQLVRISSSTPLPLIDQLASSFTTSASTTASASASESTANATDNSNCKDTYLDQEAKAEAEESERKKKEKDTQVLKLIGIDPMIIQNVLNGCTGGERMSKLIEQQKIIVRRISEMSTLATRLKSAAQLNTEQARQTTRAIEILDRLSLSISDLSDSLEQVVATSNILGAAHFAEDDEMCSFKNYLKHKPPQL